ncbi:hypothetical protein [Streptomyces sp. NPDC051162]|uniref:hypothetical protein n=1 Tax=Streptomyces sp. NPDC051162 TaxID=3154747 RepID=UPI003416220D
MDQTTTARRVITKDEYEEACRRVHVASRLSGEGVANVVAAALSAVGVLTPPLRPDELEPGCCTAQAADDHGYWLQCGEDPGHAGESHGDGDFGWTDEYADAIPPQD